MSVNQRGSGTKTCDDGDQHGSQGLSSLASYTLPAMVCVYVLEKKWSRNQKEEGLQPQGFKSAPLPRMLEQADKDRC